MLVKTVLEQLRVPGVAVHYAGGGHWLDNGAGAVGDGQGGALRIVSIGYQAPSWIFELQVVSCCNPNTRRSDL